jgi:hypothetical protein
MQERAQIRGQELKFLAETGLDIMTTETAEWLYLSFYEARITPWDVAWAWAMGIQL